jgi:two-component SAPR family response regulator
LYFIYKWYRPKKENILSSVKVGYHGENPVLSRPEYTANTTDAARGHAFPEGNIDQEDTKSATEEIVDYEMASNRESAAIPAHADDAGSTLKSRIMLFGYFEIVTSDGHNITRQFTPLLKEMFLLILIDSLRYNKGVSSERLNDILWKGKDIKDAKNNRSVNLVKLKNILEKLGGCTISRETGAWKFEYDPSLVYIDLLEYLNLFTGNGSTAASMQANKLLTLLRTGAFLKETHYDWLDSIKAEISNSVIETLLAYSESVNIHTETEKMISICNAIFCFDELNEHALKLKCKCLIALGNHTLAKNTFTKFTTKYNEIYGANFNETYQSLIGD